MRGDADFLSPRRNHGRLQKIKMQEFAQRLDRMNRRRYLPNVVLMAPKHERDQLAQSKRCDSKVVARRLLEDPVQHLFRRQCSAQSFTHRANEVFRGLVRGLTSLV
jgi:hypothetical protein